MKKYGWILLAGIVLPAVFLLMRRAEEVPSAAQSQTVAKQKTVFPQPAAPLSNLHTAVWPPSFIGDPSKVLFDLARWKDFEPKKCQ